MKVLIGYDGSPNADAAIDDLKRGGLPEDAEAIVLSAVEWPAVQAIRSWGMVETDFSPEWIERIKAAEQLAEAGADRLQRLFPRWNIRREPSAGNPSDAILEMAKAWPADLIVVGTHGHSALARVVLGSVSLKLIREAPCSVRVARSKRHEGPVHIVIGIDGSAEAEAALNEVCRRSWPVGTEARVLAVHEMLVLVDSGRISIGEPNFEQFNEDEYFRMRRVAKDGAEQLRRAGLVASPIVQEGDPKTSVVQEAQHWDADAIFVGARGLGRVEVLLLGSVSWATVAHAPCTVEVVRHH